VQKKCSICGEEVGTDVIECPKCGRGVFETEKQHHDSMNTSEATSHTGEFYKEKTKGGFWKNLFKRNRTSLHKPGTTTANYGETEFLTKDAMTFDLGFWLGMLQVSVETGNVHDLSQENLKPIMRRVKSLMDGLGLKSGIDPKRGIESIKEEVERSCSPSCRVLFLVGLLLGDIGHPHRPIRDPKEIEMIGKLIQPLGISELLLRPLLQAFSQSPPPSEHFNAALVNVKRELIQALNAK